MWAAVLNTNHLSKNWNERPLSCLSAWKRREASLYSLPLRRRRQRPGFTLMELIVVVGILAVLAGLMVPALTNMWRPAQTAAEADTQAELINYISMFENRTQFYPDQFDSLLTSGGAAAYSKDNPDLLASTGKQKLAIVPLTNDATNGMYLTSLNMAGIKNVMWHDETVTPASNSGTLLHLLATGDNVAAVNPASSEGILRIRSIFPASNGVLPTGTQLFVFGVGPMNTAVGVTMASAPVSPHPESYTYYRRYLAVFAAYADGTRAHLKTVFDRHGDTLDTTLSKYMQESKPE
jgi:prepilin-type N-terminal cleavage/methylation domain-containing protein